MDYLNIIRQAEESHKRTALDEKASRSIHAGDCVYWEGPDGKQRGPAMVDFVHTDDDGVHWAFCTTDEGWAAVNLKYVQVKDHKGS